MNEFKRDKTFNELMVDKMRYYINIILEDKEAFPKSGDIDFSHFYNPVTKKLYAALRLLLVKREVSSQVDKHIFFPSSLWQHFKASVKVRLPNFLGKHISVKMERYDVTTSVYHMCPHIGVRNKNSHLEFLTNGDEKNGFSKSQSSDMA